MIEHIPVSALQAALQMLDVILGPMLQFLFGQSLFLKQFCRLVPDEQRCDPKGGSKDDLYAPLMKCFVETGWAVNILIQMSQRKPQFTSIKITQNKNRSIEGQKL
ncbi:hypothetical protein GOODEAATRI_012894 [Goodea atripinnis]|uniref:Uncharacterized protein n=1 Tax=Goodea atripinnis TaxID=208336 RepID=A0ABV0NVC6_9TELE